MVIGVQLDRCLKKGATTSRMPSPSQSDPPKPKPARQLRRAAVLSHAAACGGARVIARGVRQGRFALRDSEAFGRDVALACEQMGPTFIKLGQVLSCRPD